MYCSADNRYLPKGNYPGITYQEVLSEWLPTDKPTQALTLDITLKKKMPNYSHSVVLAVGICYGVPSSATTIMQAKKAGCAKVLGVE